MKIRGINAWRSAVCCILATALAANASVIIQLKVIEGEGVVYRTGVRATRGLTVLVTDENGKPVENAAVSFRLPEEGASGLFNSGLRTEVVTTGADGRATVLGVQWNKTPGPVEIRITAVKDQARAGLVSTQYLSDVTAFGAGAQNARTPRAVAPNAIAPNAVAPNSVAPKPVALKAVAPKVVAPKAVDLNAVAPNADAPRAGAPKAGGEGVFTASHKSHKWLWIAAIAGGGAAAGMAFGRSHNSSTGPGVIAASTAPGGIVIGTPSITVGHP